MEPGKSGLRPSGMLLCNIDGRATARSPRALRCGVVAPVPAVAAVMHHRSASRLAASGCSARSPPPAPKSCSLPGSIPCVWLRDTFRGSGLSTHFDNAVSGVLAFNRRTRRRRRPVRATRCSRAPASVRRTRAGASTAHRALRFRESPNAAPGQSPRTAQSSYAPPPAPRSRDAALAGTSVRPANASRRLHSASGTSIP